MDGKRVDRSWSGKVKKIKDLDGEGGVTNPRVKPGLPDVLPCRDPEWGPSKESQGTLLHLV